MTRHLWLMPEKVSFVISLAVLSPISFAFPSFISPYCHFHLLPTFTSSPCNHFFSLKSLNLLPTLTLHSLSPLFRQAPTLSLTSVILLQLHKNQPASPAAAAA